MPRRHLALAGPGRVLVSTDLHGHFDDFRRLEAVFHRLRAEGPTHWVILGDLVHGPDEGAGELFPELYAYADRSVELVDAVVELLQAFPDEVHYVLGNHDHAHLGGPTTRKFHDDEVAYLEANMTERQRDRMRALFADALLLVTTSCGVALAHGAPPPAFAHPSELDTVELPCADDAQRRLVMAMTTPYGQPRDVADAFLRAATGDGPPQTVLAHGHDKDEEGYFEEHGNQACPVLFGAARANKAYLVLDLDARYPDTSALREGEELRRLYAPR